jgi:tetratricopeptide (TPR) repeat protein
MKRNPFKLLIALLIAAALPSAPAVAELSALELYKKGHLAEIQEDYPAAIEQYKEALLLNPNYFDPVRGLARSYYAIEEYEEALGHINKAIALDKSNWDLYNIKGEILIGLGNLRDASGLFTSVMAREPNNIDARFGLAELDILAGKVNQAKARYMESLKILPNGRKALLKLVDLFLDLNDLASAAFYVEISLKSYPNDPEVNMTAARFYLKQRDFKSAGYYIATALSLKKDYFEVMQLSGIALLLQQKYQDAIAVLNQSLTERKAATNYIARYLLGYAHSLVSDFEEAVKQYLAALALRYDDEVSRIACEIQSIAYKDLPDRYRQTLAEYHLKQGQLFESQDMLKKALMEYRRALRIMPDYKDARVSYALLYKRLGFPIKYLLLLKFLSESYGYKDNLILDEIDVTLPRYYESVGFNWYGSGQDKVFDQYSLERITYKLSLFTNDLDNALYHPFAAPFFIDYLKDIFLWYDNVHIMEGEVMIGSYQEAFRKAQKDNSDYFVTLKFLETERTFQMDGVIYLTRTGAELKRFSIFRTGNEKIQAAFLKLTEDLVGLLPLRGTLLARKADQGIINLGSIHGIRKDDTFIIVKRDKIRLAVKGIGLSYADEDVIGAFKVTATDENMSEGTVAKRSFFDFINPMDEVILVKK